MSSLTVLVLILRYLLPYGKSWKRLWGVWVGAFTTLVTVWKMFRMERRETPIIFSAVFTSCCRVLRSAELQFPYQTMMQLVSTLSMVPL